MSTNLTRASIFHVYFRSLYMPGLYFMREELSEGYTVSRIISYYQLLIVLISGVENRLKKIAATSIMTFI